LPEKVIFSPYILAVLLTVLTTAFVFNIENEVFTAATLLAQTENAPKKSRAKMKTRNFSLSNFLTIAKLLKKQFKNPEQVLNAFGL